MKLGLALATVAAVAIPSAGHTELVLSQLVVELQSGKNIRHDVEVRNTGADRAYVAVEPRQVLNAGQPSEERVGNPDPVKLRLLVSPTRMILEPGQHKLLRFADIVQPSDYERVYRVTVKPVVGDVSANQTGVKVLVGYDVLVLVRPSKIVENVSAIRSARKLTWRNDGNVSVELTDGRQCDVDSRNCTDLPGKRLYAGASWTIDLKSDAPVQYNVRSPVGITKKVY